MDKEIQLYAALTHGLIACGYVFTIPYHWKRENFIRIALHLAGATYHIHSVREHIKDIHDESF